MEESISKNTILVLVVLTVVISLLGTWTVLNEVNNMDTTVPEDSTEGQGTGQVKLTILDPNEGVVGATGKVVFTKTR
ncbi:MAG: hypothetical protein ABIB43_01380 [archaeon]